MYLVRSFFILFLISCHSLGYSDYGSVKSDFVDDTGQPLKFREIPAFSPSDQICYKCQLHGFFNCIVGDFQIALEKAIEDLSYNVEAPFIRGGHKRYNWQHFDECSQRMAAWVRNFFTKDPAENYSHLQFYSEYVERMNYLYYWLNVCCEVKIRALKKDCSEYEHHIRKAKSNGSSSETIKYLEGALTSLQKSLGEKPKLYANSIKLLADDFERLTKEMLSRYNRCISRHQNAHSFYERGRINYDCGNTVEFVNDIFTLVELGYTLTPDMQVELGRAYNDSNLYNHAIKALTETLKKNPQLKEAYLERAIAYFETGNLQLALADYLNFGDKPTFVKDRNYQHFLFSLGVGVGCLKGGVDSAIEFIPTLFSTIYGLGKGLWVFASDPIGISKELVEETLVCIDYIRHNLSTELIAQLVPELRECIQKWNELEDEKKGYYVGYVLGRYGVDGFMCAGGARFIHLYKNIKRANAHLTLEAALISPAHAAAVAKASEEFFILRTEYKKKCRLHLGQQEKHIPGANNFLEGGGELTISIEHLEKIVSPQLGEGVPVRFSFGEAGYKELVDFNEIIGTHVELKTSNRIPTSLGEIHYDKYGGYHVVPVEPKKIQRILNKRNKP